MAILAPLVYCGGCIWSRVLDEFCAHFARVVMFDRPMCEWETGQSYINAYCELLTGIIRAHPRDDFALFGNSFGSLIAIEAGLRANSDRLTVVFSGCPGLAESNEFSSGIHSTHGITRTKVAKVVRDMFVFPERVPAEEIDNTLRLISNAPSARRMFKALREIPEYNVKQKLGQNRFRGLAIWGGKDKITDVGSARRFITGHTDCQFFEIENAGHCPMLDQPESFVRLVADCVAPRTAATHRLD